MSETPDELMGILRLLEDHVAGVASEWTPSPSEEPMSVEQAHVKIMEWANKQNNLVELGANLELKRQLQRARELRAKQALKDVDK